MIDLDALGIQDELEYKTVCPFIYIVGWDLGWPPASRFHSEETKAKMRESAKYKVYPEDFGEKVSNGKIGKKRKPFTEEWKRNMAKAQIGRKHPPRSDEFREKVRQQMTGTKQSEETKRKRSEALKRYHANRKQAS